jgi:hypothetical protein
VLYTRARNRRTWNNCAKTGADSRLLDYVRLVVGGGCRVVTHPSVLTPEHSVL